MKKIFLFLAISILFGLTGFNTAANKTAGVVPPVLNQHSYLPIIYREAVSVCQFGVAGLAKNAVYNMDLHIAKIGGFINWSTSPGRTLPSDVLFVRVISVRDPFDDTAAASSAASLAKSYPGSTWQIGNEPDTTYGNVDGSSQDNITAQQYGHRYRIIAQAIRTADPHAKIGFGSIVQPTTIRLYYLNLAWEQLKTEAGGATQASNLIDFWSIHSFILNEVMGEWGTGVPKGYQPSWGQPVSITNFADTYNSTIFANRIRTFRQWMKDRGQQNKALWITEYGSLFPPFDPPGINYVNVTDQQTASFMVQTFNFMMNTMDANIGMPADGNHLVQRWFWYSLNENRDTYGGTLFDPVTGAATPVGQAYIDYTRNLTASTKCLP